MQKIKMSIYQENKNGSIKHTYTLKGTVILVLLTVISVIFAFLSIVCFIIQANERYSLQNIPSMGESKSIYFGQVNNGLPNGFGKEFKNEEIKYVGDFNFGTYEGNGTQYVVVNDQPKVQYEGQFKENAYCGSGIYYEYDSNGQVSYKYDGGWYMGARMGYAKETFYEDGKITSRYAGTFFDGARTGFCTWKYTPKKESGLDLDYIIYVGRIDNSSFNGEGVFYKPDGSIYQEGIFENGVLTESTDAHKSWVFPNDRIWD